MQNHTSFEFTNVLSFDKTLNAWATSDRSLTLNIATIGRIFLVQNDPYLYFCMSSCFMQKSPQIQYHLIFFHIRNCRSKLLE